VALEIPIFKSKLLNIDIMLPRFILGDNTDHPDDIYIIHTEYPKFIINLADDSIEWMEEIEKNDQEHLKEEMQNFVKEASDFYDREIERFQEKD
jgi:hypothetical protein